MELFQLFWINHTTKEIYPGARKNGAFFHRGTISEVKALIKKYYKGYALN